METLTIITGCLTWILKSSCDLSCLCISATIITLGILVFILLMRVLKYYHLEKEKKAEREHELALKEKQKEAKVEEEKQLFRQQLTSFLEMRAKMEKTASDKNDSNIITDYINELKSLIKTLNPEN